MALATATDINGLKNRLKTELNRRSGYGSLHGWATNFTDTATVGSKIVTSQLRETKDLASGDASMSSAPGGLIKYEDINAPITKLEGGTSSKTGCSGLCTGFCTSTCSGSTSGVTCSDCFGTCSTACTLACAAGCTDNCRATCASGCINTCSGTCANKENAS